MHEEKLPHVLIVDDNLSSIQLLAELLQGSCDLSMAESGSQVLEFVERELPDLILLDVLMPEMNGFEVCRRLKQSERTREIPVIFLTAETNTDSMVKGFELGGVDYVTKPFRAAELLARVRSHLDLKRTREKFLALSEERKHLVQILCHDLANPLVTIAMFLEAPPDLMDFDCLRSELRKLTDRGLAIVELVRKMQNLEEYRPLAIPIDVEWAVREAANLLQARLRQKKIDLDLRIPENLLISAEPTSFIASVLANLLSNAIKFSWPRKPIRVSAEEDGDSVRLSVRDYGMGIPKDMLGDLFELSKRKTCKGTAGEEGTGFGMFLARKFVLLYGGEIQVKSSQIDAPNRPRGTEVTLILKKA